MKSYCKAGDDSEKDLVDSVISGAIIYNPGGSQSVLSDCVS